MRVIGNGCRARFLDQASDEARAVAKVFHSLAHLTTRLQLCKTAARRRRLQHHAKQKISIYYIVSCWYMTVKRAAFPSTRSSFHRRRANRRGSVLAMSAGLSCGSCAQKNGAGQKLYNRTQTKVNDYNFLDNTCQTCVRGVTHMENHCNAGLILSLNLAFGGKRTGPACSRRASERATCSSGASKSSCCT